MSLKEKLKALKVANPNGTRIKALEFSIGEHEKAAREAQAKTRAIDAAVFDLKAVNPNAVVKIDTRAPDEVIQSIAAQGQIVTQTLEKLKVLLQA